MSVVATDLEPDVPQEGQEALDCLLPAFVGRLGEQYHDVDIRAGMKLAPAVAADCNQSQFP